MQLKIEQQTGGTDKNRNWTLKPNSECIIGSGSDCNITLPYPDIVSDRHLRLYFDKYTQTWQAQDLGSSNGTFIDSQRITDYQITKKTRIAVGGGIFITVTPVGNVVTNAPAPPPEPIESVYTPRTSKLLSILIEQTSGEYEEWELQPNRECIIGSGSGCDIVLPYPKILSSRHLKLFFDQSTQTWQAQDLSGNGTFIDSQRVTNYQIAREARISFGGGIFITVTPEGNTPVRSNTNRNQSYSRKVLSWREYVEKQAAKLEGIGHLATWFHMTTGFRNTPWISGFGSNDKGNNFNSFDGYILPEFQESEKVVIDKIEDRLSKMQQYQDTDCFVASLTDAHIADSATQSFLGVELFPIRRSKSNEADYRRFCVVSYHRVRTYLLVENYGSDLFVSWVTRFEPDPTSVIMVLWLILAIFLTLFALVSDNFFIFITPLTIWSEIYWLTPLIMQSMNIVPKKANARLVMGLLVVPTVFFISIAAGIAAFQTYFPY